jgi:hypothetical protein
MTHHPHVHMIVPGGGIALDGTRWISSRPAFLLPVRVLGACSAGCSWPGWRCSMPASSAFFGAMAPLADRGVPAPPVARPEEALGGLCQAAVRRAAAVLAYLSRYTHRVAISNRRLLAFDETGVTFRYKDYRRAVPNGSRS